MSPFEFRPSKIEELFGQQHLQPILAQWQADTKLIPHTILLSGPYGMGKTSIARMLANWLTVNPANVTEMNAADARGIDEVRDLADNSRFNPIGGGGRVYIIDELHQMTQQAQSALLKVLEDGPKSTYFILCSTDPQKILNTIKSRCTPLTVKLLNKDAAAQYANWLGQWWFQKEFAPDVIDAIYARSAGHARDIVQLVRILGQGGNFDNVDAMPGQWGAGQAISAMQAIIAGKMDSMPSLVANAEPNIYAIDNEIDRMALDSNSPVFKAYGRILTLRSNRKLYLISPQEYVLGVVSTCKEV